MDLIRASLSKIELVLPKEKQGSLNKTLLFSPFSRMTATISNIMLETRTATDDRKKGKLYYKRADGESSERIIWTLDLFFWGSAWTIGAWCEKRTDFRIFRLNRIKKLILLDEHYPQEKGKMLKDLIEKEQKCGC